MSKNPWLALAVTAQMGCGSAPPPRAPLPEARSTQAAAPAVTASPPQAKPSAPATEGPDEAVIAQAKTLAAEGARLFHDGSYERAEQTLSQALALYPLLPEANLALGKILLMRGSATSDPKLLASARRMIDMALSLDPDSAEAKSLLELFSRPKLE